MKKRLPILFLILLVPVLAFFFVSATAQETITLPDGKEIFVEVADEPMERSVGLSNRDFLAEDDGMLFVFDRPQIVSFWMKDTLIPLDMIWVDENMTVVGVQADVNPDTYPMTFSPESEVVYVLELNGGRASELGISAGTMLDFDI